MTECVITITHKNCGVLFNFKRTWLQVQDFPRSRRKILLKLPKIFTHILQVKDSRPLNNLVFICFLIQTGRAGNHCKSIASSELKLNIKKGQRLLVRVLFSNTSTRLLYNELEIFNAALSFASCSIENFSFIVQ